MSSLPIPILGYVVLDKTGKALLYDPTILQFTETLQIDIPFIYDEGSFTIFRDKPTVENIKRTYQYEFNDFNYKVVTVPGVSEDSLAATV